MRILVCVDDDSVLETVLDAVDGSVATTKWDDLLVLHVVPDMPLVLASRRHDQSTRAKALLRRVAKRLSQLPAGLETFTTAGDPARAILRVSEERGADLIVVGARGEPHDFPMGSVSQKVVAHADVDVLVVRRPELPRENDSVSGFRALVTVDGSQGSEAGIRSFIQKLRAHDATIRLVHVIEALPSLWEVGSFQQNVSGSLVRQAEEILSRARTQFEIRGLEAECEWLQGAAAARILEVARRNRTEVIVVGSRGHTQIQALVLGTLTQRILRHAPCSVLCARAWWPESAARTSWFTEALDPQVGMA